MRLCSLWEKKKRRQSSPLLGRRYSFCLITCKADEPLRCPFSCSLRVKNYQQKPISIFYEQVPSLLSQFFNSFSAQKEHLLWDLVLIESNLCRYRYHVLIVSPREKREGGRKGGREGTWFFLCLQPRKRQSRQRVVGQRARGQRWRNYLDTLVTDLYAIKKDKNKLFWALINYAIVDFFFLWYAMGLAGS